MRRTEPGGVTVRKGGINVKEKIVVLLSALACAALIVSAAVVWDGKSAEPAAVEETPPPAWSVEPTKNTPEEVEPPPFTEDEIVMLAQTMYAEAAVVRWYGDQFGVSYQARQAAVAWVALNRLDAGGYGDTLAEVLSRPAQFAYSPDAPITAEMMALARDVTDRWWAEKQGETDVGRTLPSDYLFFDGDGKENYFRQEYRGTDHWDWSLPDPYKEG